MRAICFECEVELMVGKSMEELLDMKFPVFCCQACADNFPDNGTKEFEDRIIDLKQRLRKE